MPKKATSNEVLKEYRRQRARVNQFVNRAKKKGWLFSENVVPKIPKTVTPASVRKLARLTPEALYKKGVYNPEDERFQLTDETGVAINVLTGEVIKEAPSFVRADDYLPNDDFLVVAGLKSALLGFPQGLTQPLISLINDLISEYGQESVAKAIRDMPDSFGDTLMRHKNDSKGAVEDFAQAIIEYLPYVGELTKEELFDKFNEYEGGFELYE